MYTTIYFIISILWLYVFHSFRPNISFGALMITFVGGMIAAPMAGFISIFLKNEFIPAASQNFNFTEFALYFFIVGPVEEAMKFLAVLFTSLYRENFKSSLDGIVLAASSALGFACLENILYLYIYGVDHTLPRLILGNLGHVSYAVLWGYAFGVILHESASFLLLIIAMLVAAILHGAYNYMLTGVFGILGPIFAFSLSLLLYIATFKLLQIEKRRNL